MNHTHTHMIMEDIRHVDALAVATELGLRIGELDLLAGCPPCQGFSRLRTKNGRYEAEDSLNDLVFEFTRFVRELLPRTVMMENVPALAADWRMAEIRQQLHDAGYESRVAVLDAALFGVPQRRRRMILVAGRAGCPEFAAQMSRKRTVRQAIGKMPQPCASDDPAHNYTVRRAGKVMDFIRNVPIDGGSRGDVPAEQQLECHRRIDGFMDIYGRMAWREPAPTITSGCINPSKGRYVHPVEDRAITVREAAMLQSFPKTYAIDMSRGRYPAAQLIGNAFPPKFAEHHGREIYCYLQARALDGDVMLGTMD